MSKSVKFKVISSMIVAAMVIGTVEAAAMAWEQPAHQQINAAAVGRFESTYAFAEKYKGAEIDLDEIYQAPVVTNPGYFSMTYEQTLTPQAGWRHIMDGGFSADEPNIFVSVKHFFDPLALSGVHELTDQERGHGLVYEAIPATEWALYREDNAYCLENAMLYYKKACEIPYTAKSGVIPATNGDFRDIAATAADLEDMRNIYTGKALKGIGEVMHLVADMTQPAHVRNDSHPRAEITEQTITGGLAAVLVKGPRLDDFDVSSGIGGGLVQALMMNLATWTNARFYSMDTIYDATFKVDPENGEAPYSSPQMSSAKKKIWERHITYMSVFNGVEIPIAWKNLGVLWDSYEISPEIAKENGKVLLPLAVSACAKTLDIFFPTIRMTQTVTESPAPKEIVDEAIGKGAEEVRMFRYDAGVEHHSDKDPQWAALGVSISYSGPGKLWAKRGRKAAELCDVEFVNGEIAAYRDPVTDEIVEGTPAFFMVLGATKRISLADVPSQFLVEMEDTLWCTATAGAQDLKSPDYTFEINEPEITLEADRTRLMPGEEVEFKVEVENAPERYKLEWTFGDEEDDEENIKAPVVNRKKEMVHLYEMEKEYTATVRLIDTKRNVVRAQDSIGISVYMGELAGPWDLVLTVEEESSFFRAIVISIMKFIVNIILVPIVTALGGDVGDVNSELDSFTFVGSTITYQMELRRSETDEGVYVGPIVYVGSDSDLVEGNEDLQSVRLEVVKGKIVIYGIGVDEYGNQVEITFLRNGMMADESTLTGTFSFPGVMSGQWAANKK